MRLLSDLLPAAWMPALALLLLPTTPDAFAQNVADTHVTDPGRLVIETGAVYTRDDANGERIESLSLPSTLLRTGLRDETELQVGWAAFQWTRVDRDTERGTADATIALKQLLSRESLRFPRMAVLVGTSLPVGSDSFTSERFDPMALGIFEYAFGAHVTATAHTGIQWTTDSDDDGHRSTDGAGVYALAVHYDVSPSTQGFIEGFGEMPIDDGSPAHTIDVGLLQKLGDAYEVSAWYGRGLSEAAEDHQLATELVLSF